MLNHDHCKWYIQKLLYDSSIPHNINVKPMVWKASSSYC